MGDSDYKQLYIKTANEYLKTMGQLLARDVNQMNASTIEELHRVAHSIKGMSYAMNYTQTATLARIIELYFLKIMTKERNMTSEELKIIESVRQHIFSIVKHISEQEKETDSTSFIATTQQQLHISFPTS